MRLRLLPLFILVAGLAMTAKLAGIWQDIGGSQPALAQETAAGEMPLPAPAGAGEPAAPADPKVLANLEGARIEWGQGMYGPFGGQVRPQ